MSDNVYDMTNYDLLINEDDEIERPVLALTATPDGEGEAILDLSVHGISVEVAIAFLEEAIEMLVEAGILDDED